MLHNVSLLHYSSIGFESFGTFSPKIMLAYWPHSHLVATKTCCTFVISGIAIGSRMGTCRSDCLPKCLICLEAVIEKVNGYILIKQSNSLLKQSKNN